MFQGVDYGSMDPKGRLAIPARHRELLKEIGDDRPILTAHHKDRCLVLRPHAVWKSLAEKIKQLPNADPEVQAFQRKLLGYAQEVTVDANGRILLPAALRVYACIKKQVAIAGLGESLELWHASSWDDQVSRPLKNIPQALVDLRL